MFPWTPKAESQQDCDGAATVREEGNPYQRLKRGSSLSPRVRWSPRLSLRRSKGREKGGQAEGQDGNCWTTAGLTEENDIPLATELHDQRGQKPIWRKGK